MFEFWFGKLDVATSEGKKKAPTANGVPVPSTYFAALAFIALDRDSPWRLDEHAAGDALAGVAMAISKVHDRMKMPQLVEKMSQHADAVRACDRARLSPETAQWRSPWRKQSSAEQGGKTLKVKTGKSYDVMSGAGAGRAKNGKPAFVPRQRQYRSTQPLTRDQNGHAGFLIHTAYGRRRPGRYHTILSG